MNIENYFSASKVIHEEMAQIAQVTHQMALVSCAESTNPMFVESFKKYEQLVEKFNHLHAEFVSTDQNSSSAV